MRCNFVLEPTSLARMASFTASALDQEWGNQGNATGGEWLHCGTSPDPCHGQTSQRIMSAMLALRNVYKTSFEPESCQHSSPNLSRKGRNSAANVYLMFTLC